MRSKSILSNCLWYLLLLIIFCPDALGKIIYVDDDTSADFNTIQAAIDDANDGDTVLVAAGTYTGDGNRDIDFRGKAITVRSIDPNDPNIVSATIIDCQGSEEDSHRGFQFVSGEGRDSVLAGLKIINGSGTEIYIPDWYRLVVGGAVLCLESSPTIYGCVIERNVAQSDGLGGGVCCFNSSAAITKCIVQYNEATVGGGIYCDMSDVVIDRCIVNSNICNDSSASYIFDGCGGGICCFYSSATITKCRIQHNESYYFGGGIYWSNGSVVIDQCIVSSNIGHLGGGIYLDYVSGSVQNCLISNNLSKGDGGGILYDYTSTDITLDNCTIVRNHASNESSTVGGVAPLRIHGYEKPVILTNCILWGNSGGYRCDYSTQVYLYSTGLTLSHCCVQGWTPERGGDGNFKDNPLLTLDFHLRADSPCINAGIQSDAINQSMDIDDESREPGEQVDIGCDEYIDLDNDGLADFWELRHFGTTANVEARQNPDDDNWTNLQEYNQGSNPNYHPDTFYVDVIDGNDSWDGLSSVWDGQHGPKATIQAAINQATSYERDTIVLAPGTYTGDGNRDVDFKGKAITVKSKDGPESCIIDCNGTLSDPHRGFYFYRCGDANSVLQGVTIINGYESGGGGIFCGESSPTIRECVISSNTADYFTGDEYYGSGGGIFINCSSALIQDCQIIDNLAIPIMKIVADGGRGGGVCCCYGNLTIIDSDILNNDSAGSRSGAVYCLSSDVIVNNSELNYNGSNGIYINSGDLKITDCLISNNEDDGIKCEGNSEAIIRNCDILNNQTDGIDCYASKEILMDKCLIAGNYAGGVYTRKAGDISIINCTIIYNSIGYHDGIYCDNLCSNIRNCIVWGNKHSQIELDAYYFDNPSCSISYSNIQGAMENISIDSALSLDWGQGNLNLEPAFAIPGYLDDNGTRWHYADDFYVLGDYHLKSQAGRWNPASGSWVVDDVTSPCINAGDPNTPLGDEPFPNGGIINMGAYGGTIEARKSYFDEPPCETIIAGDINGDCRVDLKDFTLFANNWLKDKLN